jgi:hypothetical protein
MRFPLAVALLVVSLAGCKRGAETARVGESRDTVVTNRQTQDTAIVTHDTTVKVDTSMRRGERTLRADTVKKTGGARRGAADTSTAR